MGNDLTELINNELKNGYEFIDFTYPYYPEGDHYYFLDAMVAIMGKLVGNTMHYKAIDMFGLHKVVIVRERTIYDERFKQMVEVNAYFIDGFLDGVPKFFKIPYV